MLRLKMPTDPRWVKLAEENLEELLTDHAYCEQKAASSAISIIVNYPEYDDIVAKMSEVAIEELDHFKQVHQKLLDRGWKLGKERKDHYVNDLRKFFPGGTGKKVHLINKLLFSAMIEARSCERFRMLHRTVADKDLSEFYHDLEQSEAQHYALFINLAKKHAPTGMDVESKWQEFLDYEASLMAKYCKTETMHG
jgi:tRNA-(ms[2]io[6]A)-hydroxylase